jgi:hypothetical protein
MSGWNTSDAGALPLEALRKSDTVLAAFSPKYDCAVLVARSKGGKRRVLGAWSDALHNGEIHVGAIISTGAGVDVRSVGMWFDD